jgi:hypothetical protein
MTQFNQLNNSYDDENDDGMNEDPNVLYCEWMSTVSSIVFSQINIDLDDLPDENYRINFDEEMSPEDMASIVLGRYYYS